MAILLFLLPAGLAGVIAFALTAAIRRIPASPRFEDQAIPRLGGLAVVAAVSMVLTAIHIWEGPDAQILSADLLQAIAIGGLPIMIVSLIDDLRPLSALPRFIVHLASASVTVALGVSLAPVIHVFGSEVQIGWLAYPISVLWLAGTTNAFNLVDGLDGLSAGLALISAISLSAVSIATQRYEMAGTALVLAGALAGFLPFNVYPAKVYLGDSGATTIGFFLGALTLRGGSTTSAGLAVILPILVIGVPVAETLLSMARRLVRRFRGDDSGIFKGDHDHIHHRLLALGYHHKKAVLLMYCVALLVAACALGSLFLKEENAVLLLVSLLIAAFVGVAKLGYDEFAIIRSGAVLRMYDKPVLKRSLFVAFADFGLIVASIYAAIVLKYDDWGITTHRDLAMNLLAVAPTAVVVVLAALGMYRRSWGHASVEDFVRLSAAVTVASGATLIISTFVFGTDVPLTFFLLYTIIAFGVMNGARASHRILYLWDLRISRKGDPVVIYGAGKRGILAIREILANREIGMRPVGFIDDDPIKIGRIINGYPVIGNLDSLDAAIRNGAKGVVIAADSIPAAKLRYAQRVSESKGVWLTSFEVNFIRPSKSEEKMAEV